MKTPLSLPLVSRFLLLLLAGAAPLQAQEAPAVLTLPATGMTNTVATLRGTVYPGGADTTVWFEWGTVFSYENRTAPVPAGNGTAQLTLSNSLSGLVPGVLYHGRIAASNAVGVARGNDLRFGSPVLTLNGAATVTNECHAAPADPGVTVAVTLVSLAGGENHALALRSDGKVVAWGTNNYGQTNIPVGVSNVMAIAAGDVHNLALRRDGRVVAWGHNGFSQTNVPAGLSNVVAIAAGNYHNLALKNDGQVAAWGSSSSGKTDVPAGLSNVVAVAGGESFSLALRADGKVFAWGGGSFPSYTNIPPGLSNVVAIAAGYRHSLALTDNGRVVAWGDNSFGETNVPPGLSNVVAIAAGDYHSLALRNDGTIIRWGGTDPELTNAPSGLSNVVAIAAGDRFNLVLLDGGTAVAWGSNAGGQTNLPAALSAPIVTTGGIPYVDGPGSSPQTYLSTNACGGIGTIMRTVVVQDTVPPVITIAGKNPVTNALNAPYADLGAVAQDACGGSFPVGTVSNVNVSVIGRYAVVYTATDSFGNTRTNVRTVVVDAVILTGLPPTRMTNTVATLNGIIRPGGAAATVWFEWGTTTNYGQQTAAQPVIGSLTMLAVSNNLTGLTPGVLYHGRLAASNVVGLSYGANFRFGSPALALNGTAVLTNECHVAFADPGATATSMPLAISAGGIFNLVLKGNRKVAAWGNGGYGETNPPASLANVTAIACGGGHGLALKPDGTVTAWGRNDYGQTNVPAGLNDVAAIAAGTDHSLVLRSNGLVAVWGSGNYSQSFVPESVSNMVVAAVAAGGQYNLLLKPDGGVYAWGGMPVDYETLTQVSNVVAIAAGTGHSLLVKNDGRVVALSGSNTYGQTNIPAGLSNVVAIVAGYNHSLALKRDGTVVAWGRNHLGQTNIPDGLSNVVAIAAGGDHSLALQGNGELVAWGSNTAREGDIPEGVNTLPVTASGTVNVNTPGTYQRLYTSTNSLGGTGVITCPVVVQDTQPPVVTLTGKNPFTNVVNTPFTDPGATALDACGGSFAVFTNGTVNPAVPGTYTVAYRATDSFGNSATNVRTVLVMAVAPAVLTLPAPATNTLATLQGTVNPDGAAATAWFEWGTTVNLGSATPPQSLGSGSVPLPVSQVLSNLAPGVLYYGRLAASNSLGLARGKILRFGSPALVLTGPAALTNECHETPADPGATASSPVLAVAAGDYHGLALRSDGKVMAWGRNNLGQANVPASLSNATVVAVAAGGNFSLALKADGRVTAWGQNTATQTNVPAAASNVVAMAAGNAHALALKADGKIVAWGNNADNQTSVPAGLSNVVAVAAGGNFSLALTADGKVTAWGQNNFSQTNVPAGLGNVVPVVAIAAGFSHSLALRADGTCVGWGNNDYNQATIPLGLAGGGAIAAGGYHSLAVKSDGQAVAWGYGTLAQTAVPIGLNGVATVAGGLYHSLALKNDGTIVGWGDNVYGQTDLPPGLTNLTVAVSGTINGDAPGNYALSYIATNILGGTAQLTRSVVVQDTLPPVLTVLGNNPLTNFLGRPFLDPGATALDACGGGFAVMTNGVVNVHVPGSYTVTYSSTDSSGHTANRMRTVVILELPPFTAGELQFTNGVFAGSFTNVPGAGFTVLASTNAALPLASWLNLGPATETPAGSGRFRFADPQATNQPARFYRLRSP